MSFKFGGKGLTLIEATHVLLVEPSINPGIESQAIGRIHRIGQTNTTYVHHFIIKDTIEENIKKMNEDKNSEEWKISSKSDILSLDELDKLYGTIKRPLNSNNNNDNQTKRRRVGTNNKNDFNIIDDELDYELESDNDININYWELKLNNGIRRIELLNALIENNKELNDFVYLFYFIGIILWKISTKKYNK